MLAPLKQQEQRGAWQLDPFATGKPILRDSILGLSVGRSVGVPHPFGISREKNESRTSHLVVMLYLVSSVGHPKQRSTTLRLGMYPYRNARRSPTRTDHNTTRAALLPPYDYGHAQTERTPPPPPQSWTNPKRSIKSIEEQPTHGMVPSLPKCFDRLKTPALSTSYPPWHNS